MQAKLSLLVLRCDYIRSPPFLHTANYATSGQSLATPGNLPFLAPLAARIDPSVWKAAATV